MEGNTDRYHSQFCFRIYICVSRKETMLKSKHEPSPFKQTPLVLPDIFLLKE